MHRPTRLQLAGLAVVLAASVAQPLVGASATLAATPASHDHATHGHGTGPADRCETLIDGVVTCVHADEPPPGVDITRMPTLEELRRRQGAGSGALTALQTGGVPAPAQYAAGSTVPCDGDGTSGPRVQAVYVVSADRPNRFASLKPSISTWAAGISDIVSRSAARTGAVRSVRYVTGPAVSGACTPTVLNVTVPAGANASFTSTIDAVRAQGYTDPSRKYLMWVDTTGYCGVATTYPDDRAGQDNANNGRYPMYARTDAACWGHPEAVEAHELVHTLGAVQRSAPHSTANGHCTDAYDLMCYPDAQGVTMQHVCGAGNETLLDCRNDDYFLAGTPAAGNYLATHWNTADSRFLISTASGTSGGTGGGETAPAGVRISTSVDGAGEGARLTVCPKAKVPATAKVVDSASGSPVAGVKVQFVQTLSGKVRSLGTATTTADGTATRSITAAHGATITSRVASGAYAGQASTGTTLSAGTACATSIEARLESATGGSAVVTGTLTRTLDGVTAPVSGARVSLLHTPAGSTRAKVIARAKTGTDGTFRFVRSLPATGTLTVRYAKSASYAASDSAPLSVTR